LIQFQGFVQWYNRHAYTHKHTNKQNRKTRKIRNNEEKKLKLWTRFFGGKKIDWSDDDRSDRLTQRCLDSRWACKHIHTTSKGIEISLQTSEKNCFSLLSCSFLSFVIL
jgi:hypothetical protein